MSMLTNYSSLHKWVLLVEGKRPRAKKRLARRRVRRTEKMGFWGN